jgi:cytosine/adenosine deaminase-related metal-dependent hydrolase/ubiquinone/menaquinone biosynthesis C-methylase UbiE
MTATAVSPSEVFNIWAPVYDEQPNPLLALEQRFLSHMLPDVSGLDVLDAGCGTGRWLQILSSRHPGSLIGVDLSTQMLHRAAAKLGSSSSLRLGSCNALPISDATVDLVIASFVLSYLENLQVFVNELSRVTRPGATVFLTDMHPNTAISCNWKRSFKVNGARENLPAKEHFLLEITEMFQACGFELLVHIEPHFDSNEKKIFAQNEKLEYYDASVNQPAIYILQLRKKTPLASKVHHITEDPTALLLLGANYAAGVDATTPASLVIEHGHIRSISSKSYQYRKTSLSPGSVINLTGYLLLPGLINAHDHLEFSLFPNLGAGPYQNSTEWAAEIHRTHAFVIARHRKVPKSVRLWWGAIRNLLCGATTVCHHNPLSREILADDFPVRVLSKFGWAHSLAMDPNLLHNFDHTPSNFPFILHAAEGVDAKSAQEIFDLDRMQLLDERTVVVHGLALTPKAVALLNRRHSALVICPTSNQFLFRRVPDTALIKSVRGVVLGSDSPLTCAGDLLNEINFAYNEIGLDARLLYEMVTTRSADVLRLRHGEGVLRPGSMADLIAVQDRGLDPAQTVAQLTFDQIELVILAGRVQLASDSLYELLPKRVKEGLHPLVVEGHKRWLRAPINDLLTQAKKTIGNDLRLGGKRVEHAGAA